jgi:hypothetical protein
MAKSTYCLYRAMASAELTEEAAGCELAVVSPLATLAQKGAVEGLRHEVVPPLAVMTQGGTVCKGVQCWGEYSCRVLACQLDQPTQ